MPLYYDRHGREYKTTPPARLIERLRTEPHTTSWFFNKGESIARALIFHTNKGQAEIIYNAEGAYLHISCTKEIAELLEETRNAIP